MKRKVKMRSLISILYLTMLFAVVGCTNQQERVMDWNIGVRYSVESEENRIQSGSVIIRMDPNDKEKMVLSLYLSAIVEDDTTDNVAAKLAEENSEDYNDYMNMNTVYYSEPIYSTESDSMAHSQTKEQVGVEKRICLNFFRDEFDAKEYPMIIEWLGLTEELKDGILTYHELMESETFRYRWILEEGEFSNNISFTNESKYDYPLSNLEN